MKKALIALLLTLQGCGSFSFRPGMVLVCTSPCTASLLPPAQAASGVPQ